MLAVGVEIGGGRRPRLAWSSGSPKAAVASSNLPSPLFSSRASRRPLGPTTAAAR